MCHLTPVINDLFEAGVQDDKLALLYEINKTNRVAVKTADGLSERKEIKTKRDMSRRPMGFTGVCSPG